LKKIENSEKRSLKHENMKKFGFIFEI